MEGDAENFDCKEDLEKAWHRSFRHNAQQIYSIMLQIKVVLAVCAAPTCNPRFWNLLNYNDDEPDGQPVRPTTVAGTANPPLVEDGNGLNEPDGEAVAREQNRIEQDIKDLTKDMLVGDDDVHSHDHEYMMKVLGKAGSRCALNLLVFACVGPLASIAITLVILWIFTRWHRRLPPNPLNIPPEWLDQQMHCLWWFCVRGLEGLLGLWIWISVSGFGFLYLSKSLCLVFSSTLHVTVMCLQVLAFAEQHAAAAAVYMAKMACLNSCSNAAKCGFGRAFLVKACTQAARNEDMIFHECDSAAFREAVLRLYRPQSVVLAMRRSLDRARENLTLCCPILPFWDAKYSLKYADPDSAWEAGRSRWIIGIMTTIVASIMMGLMVQNLHSACPFGFPWLVGLIAVASSVLLAIAVSWAVGRFVKLVASTNGGPSVVGRRLSLLIFVVAALQACIPVWYSHKKSLEKVDGGSCPQGHLLAEVFVNLGDVMAYSLNMHTLLLFLCAKFFEMKRMYFEVRLCSNMLDLDGVVSSVRKDFRYLQTSSQKRLTDRQRELMSKLYGEQWGDEASAPQRLALVEILHQFAFFCQTTGRASLQDAADDLLGPQRDPRESCGEKEDKLWKKINEEKEDSGRTTDRIVSDLVKKALHEKHAFGDKAPVNDETAKRARSNIECFIGMRELVLIDVISTIEPMKFVIAASLVCFAASAVLSALSLLCGANIIKGEAFCQDLSDLCENAATFYCNGVCLVFTFVTIFVIMQYIAGVNDELARHEGLLRRAARRLSLHSGEDCGDWGPAVDLASTYADEINVRDYRISWLGFEITRSTMVGFVAATGISLLGPVVDFLSKLLPLIGLGSFSSGFAPVLPTLSTV